MFVCVFSPNPFSPATLPSLHASSSCSTVSIPSSSCSALIFFGPSPGISSIATSPGGVAAFKLLVILQLAGRNQLGDLLLQRLADALHLPQPLLGHHLFQRLAQRLNRPRRVQIRRRLERILPLQLQQRRNADQHFRYLILVHAWNMVLNLPALKAQNPPPPRPIGHLPLAIGNGHPIRPSVPGLWTSGLRLAPYRALA